MELFKRVDEVRTWSRRTRAAGLTVGFVPTMGFLHEGHLSLMRQAREKCDRVAASIFVNPMQFGPKEDLAAYPRDLDRDLERMSSVPVDVVFHPDPDPEEVYPPGYQTRVEVTDVTRDLCGRYRPGHFTGVATVVLKLFHIVEPDLAIFGEKDYQQLVTIKRMARDLNLDVRVEGGVTVREPDGLAMSSRNTYLSGEERKSARALSSSLGLARDMVAAGQRDPARIIEAVRRHIEDHPHTRVEYAELVDPETMQAVDRIGPRTLLVLSVHVGRARLIDNAVLTAS